MALEDDKLAKAGPDDAAPVAGKTPEKAKPKIEKGMGEAQIDEANLDAALANAFRKAEAAGEHDDDADDADDEPAPKKKPAPKKTEAEQAAQKRAKDGKFVAKDGDADGDEPDEKAPKAKARESEADDKSEDDEPANPKQVKAKREPVQADQADDDEPEPESWRDKRDLWKGMSREARQHVSAREKAHVETEGYLRAYQPIGETLNAYRDSFKRNGMTYEQGIGALLRMNDALEKNPADTVKHIAKNYGVDLAQLAGVERRSDDGSEIDDAFDSPTVTALKQEVQELKQYLGQRHQTEAQRQAQQAQLQKQSNLELVNKFAADKPHFATAQTEIMEEIQRLVAKGFTGNDLLQQAYEAAIWRNPKTRAALVAEEAEKKADAAKKAAEKAKGAADLNIGDDADDTTPDGDDEDAELRRAFRKASRRESKRRA